jgi:hypothetical protein
MLRVGPIPFYDMLALPSHRSGQGEEQDIHLPIDQPLTSTFSFPNFNA